MKKLSLLTLTKNFSVESGRNRRFRHETPKVVPQILRCLKYTAFPRWILPCFSYPNKKIDVFSAENISLYTVFRHIFQRWKHQFFTREWPQIHHFKLLCSFLFLLIPNDQISYETKLWWRILENEKNVLEG